MTKAISYAAVSAKEKLGPYAFERREVGAKDVQIEILFCGVCIPICTLRAMNGKTLFTRLSQAMRS